MNLKLIFFVIILFLTTGINSQSYKNIETGGSKTCSVSGKVKDKSSGSFVEYATVSIYNQRDSSLVTGTISQPDGSFMINEIGFGMYYLEASFVGFEKTRLTKILISPQKNSVNIGTIEILPSSTKLKEAEITAQRPQIEYKIDKKVINVEQNVAASGGTAVDVLENTPSVQVDIEGNVSLRGSENFSVLIDGRPSILKGSEALQQLPASAIQNIEIITNPSAKYDPDGSAGIINIIMKKQKQAGINGIVNTSVSTNGSYGGDILLNLRKSKLNYTLGGEYNERSFGGEGDFYKEIRGDSVFIQKQKGEGEFIRNRTGIRGGIEYAIDPKISISVSGEYDEGEFGRTQSSYNHYYYNTGYDYFFTTVNDFIIERKDYEINADYIQKFNDKGHSLTASFRYSYEKSNEINSRREDTTNSAWSQITSISNLENTYENDNEKDTRFKIDYSWPISEKSNFEAGYQYRNETSSGGYHLDTASYDYRIFNTNEEIWGTRNELNNDKDFSNKFHSLYFTYSRGIGNIFDLQTGLRAEYNNRLLVQKTMGEKFKFEKFDLFPTIHISKKFNNDYQIQASYTRRVMRPRDWQLDPFKVYSDTLNVRIGNPMLKPEYTNSFELNTQKTFKGVGFISLELFHRLTENKIDQFSFPDTATNITLSTFENSDKDFSTGAEFMINMPIKKWFILNTSVSAFDHRIQSDLTGNREGFSWNTRFSAIVRLKWGMQAQLTGFYHGRETTAQGKHESGFFSNLGVKQDFLKKQLTATLQIRDIFGSAKFVNIMEGSNFYSRNEMNREAQVITLSLSYKINNYKQKNRQEEEQINEFEFGNGNE